MASTLPTPLECCTSCTTPTTTNVPGSAGDDGADGADGDAGINAYSLVAVEFTLPAQQGTVLVTLTDPAGNQWMGIAQVVAVEGAGTGGTRVGYYEVVSRTGTDQVTLLNLRDDTTGAYPDNIDGTGAETVAVGLMISPGGVQGAAGTAAAASFAVANDLNEGDPPTMRSNLGLGSLAIKNDVNNADWNGTDLSVANGGTGASTAAGARTNLGAAPTGLATASGLTVSATDKVLGRSSAGAGAVEEIACTATGRTIIAAASATAARTALGVLGKFGLLGSLLGADMNVVTDQAITALSTKYVITAIVVSNASVNLTTAQGGVYNAVGKPGGGVLVAAAQAYTALTASGKFLALTLAGVALTDVQTAGFIYLSLSTPQGAAATADISIWGYDLS